MLVVVGPCLLDDVTSCVGKGTQEGQKTKVKRACVTAKKNHVTAHSNCQENRCVNV